MRLLLLLTLSTFSRAGVTRSKEKQILLDSVSSPLDQTTAAPTSKKEDYVLPNGVSAEPPECATACSSNMLETVQILFAGANTSQRLDEACRRYDKSVACMRGLTHCYSHELFESVTSGLRYMCVEQRAAFNATTHCVDDYSSTVQKECDRMCRPESLITGMALKDTLFKGIDMVSQLDLGKMLDPHMSSIAFGESCRIGRCMMRCYRSKLNVRCDGSAGSLLMEVLVRPFTLSAPSARMIHSVIGMMLPAQCQFLLDSKALKEFHIDPQLDQDLKRMYSEKDKVGGGEPLPNDDPHQMIVDPWKNVQDHIKDSDSPIDGHVLLRRPRSHRLWKGHGSSGNEEEEEGEEEESGWTEVAGWGSGATEDAAVEVHYPQHELRLTRTADNADMFLAERIEPGIDYTVLVNVDRGDEGELVCVLRTDDPSAVNTWPIGLSEEEQEQ